MLGVGVFFRYAAVFDDYEGMSMSKYGWVKAFSLEKGGATTNMRRFIELCISEGILVPDGLRWRLDKRYSDVVREYAERAFPEFFDDVGHFYVVS